MLLPGAALEFGRPLAHPVITMRRKMTQRRYPSLMVTAFAALQLRQDVGPQQDGIGRAPHDLICNILRDPLPAQQGCNCTDCSVLERPHAKSCERGCRWQTRRRRGSAQECDLQRRGVGLCARGRAWQL